MPSPTERICNLLERLRIESRAEAQVSIWREVARVANAAREELQPQQYSPASGLMIRIPGDIVKDLSPNTRLHWREKAKRVAAWRERGHLAWLSGERREFPGKVSAEITIRRARAVDPDNALSSCKAAIDSLVRREGQPGPLRGDTLKDLRIESVEQQTGKEWQGKEEILIYLTALD